MSLKITSNLSRIRGGWLLKNIATARVGCGTRWECAMCNHHMSVWYDSIILSWNA